MVTKIDRNCSCEEHMGEFDKPVQNSQPARKGFQAPERDRPTSSEDISDDVIYLDDILSTSDKVTTAVQSFKGSASCSEAEPYILDEDSGTEGGELIMIDDSEMQQVQWAVKLFRGFLVMNNLPADFENYSASHLNDSLSKFYLEAKSKRGEPYHVSTLSDVRDGLMKYLANLSEDWKTEIYRSFVFQPSNNLLDNLQESLRETTIKPKAPMKIPMTQGDVTLLIESGCLNNDNPLGLFRKVWFDLTLHLGCGGQAALRGLCGNSFICEADEKGRRYYRLNHSIKVSRARSCMEMQYWHWDGRMYEISGDVNCPVKSMDKYLAKRNPNKDAFFQRPKTHIHPTDKVWYESPVGHGVLACLMSKMAEDACLSRTYTNSSIRVTIADLLEKKGFCVEAVMGMNPRNKSIKSMPNKPALCSDELQNNSKIIHGVMYGTSTT